MNSDSHFPSFANVWIVLAIFAAELVLFDLFLVRWLKLKKKAWRIVDYIWLVLAALGIVGAVGQARQLIASNMVSGASQRAQVSYIQLTTYVGQYSNEGPVCRTFVRGQYSPPPEEFEKIQKDYNSVCHWFWDLGRKLPTPIYSIEEVDSRSLPPAPLISENDLRDIIRSFQKQLDTYNSDAKEYAAVTQAMQHSTIEETLIMLSPLLLSFAIALRITKVTGEIKLDEADANK